MPSHHNINSLFVFLNFCISAFLSLTHWPGQLEIEVSHPDSRGGGAFLALMSFEDLQPFNVASCSVINLVCPILFIHDGRIDAVDRNTWRKKDYHTTCIIYFMVNKLLPLILFYDQGQQGRHKCHIFYLKNEFYFDFWKFWGI